MTSPASKKNEATECSINEVRTRVGARLNEQVSAIKLATRFLKDLTRRTSSLLAFGRTERAAMFQPKTHFEQIPIETVRKIVEQGRREEAADTLLREPLQIAARGFGDDCPLKRSVLDPSTNPSVARIGEDMRFKKPSG